MSAIHKNVKHDKLAGEFYIQTFAFTLSLHQMMIFHQTPLNKNNNTSQGINVVCLNMAAH